MSVSNLVIQAMLLYGIFDSKSVWAFPVKAMPASLCSGPTAEAEKPVSYFGCYGWHYIAIRLQNSIKGTLVCECLQSICQNADINCIMPVALSVILCGILCCTIWYYQKQNQVQRNENRNRTEVISQLELLLILSQLSRSQGPLTSSSVNPRSDYAGL
eukprot:m.5387 g.5387  ORF g.5387 m.5387 type:complete len:158 (+) comp13021_c0_seq2:792-1265(+)